MLARAMEAPAEPPKAEREVESASPAMKPSSVMAAWSSLVK
jgi:hypothetical protein